MTYDAIDFTSPMEDIIIQFRNSLHLRMGFGSVVWAEVILFAALALLAVMSYYLAKGVLFLAGKAVEKTPTKWDDDLLTPRFMRAVAQLAPALTINWGLPLLFFNTTTGTTHLIGTLTSFYIIWAATRILVILTGNLYVAMSRRPNTSPYAIKGIFQSLKLAIMGLGVIVALSILIGKTPVAILTALGASAAVLMLVFKDTIMGLVASVQLTANHMLKKGDWIVCERHDANGEVEDISLTTVKVRNFDNSITTIPPYALVSESFRNYEPMRESGGRRVERSIYIDINTVRFLDKESLTALEHKRLLAGYVPEDRKTVNLGLYRAYLEKYLLSRTDTNSSMLCMVRQLQPTQSGLPLQIYFFTKTTEWKEYERIQGEVMDHVYATAREFGLRIFQTPAGTDILSLGNNSDSPAFKFQKEIPT